jgi:hypothetical protein
MLCYVSNIRNKHNIASHFTNARLELTLTQRISFEYSFFNDLLHFFYPQYEICSFHISISSHHPECPELPPLLLLLCSLSFVA